MVQVRTHGRVAPPGRCPEKFPVRRSDWRRVGVRHPPQRLQADRHGGLPNEADLRQGFTEPQGIRSEGVDEMGKTLTARPPHGANGTGLNAARYGKLCAETFPKVIESDEEFDRMVEHLERLTFKQDASAEENALARLLEKLVLAYDD